MRCVNGNRTYWCVIGHSKLIVQLSPEEVGDSVAVVSGVVLAGAVTVVVEVTSMLVACVLSQSPCAVPETVSTLSVVAVGVEVVIIGNSS